MGHEWMVGIWGFAALLSPGTASVDGLARASGLAYERHAGDSSDVCHGLEVRNASGPAFVWEVSFETPDGPWIHLGVHALDEQGTGRAERSFAAPPEQTVFSRARYLLGRGIATTPPSSAAYLEEPLGEEMDADWGLGGIQLEAGTLVSVEQPWAEFVSITALNNDDAHRDAPILVDAASWTEAPTPGVLPGMRGRAARPTGTLPAADDPGLVLAVAADTTDADMDGLVDDPRPEPAGGTLILEFAGPTRAPFMELFDVDEPGGRLRAYSGTTLLAEGDMPLGNDNSLLYVSIPAGFTLITRLEIDFAGTGGLATLTLIPCPAIVNFDESSTGVPLDLAAGEELSGQYGGLGIFDGSVFALNGDPDGPDKAIVYDSSDPGGADPDLVTPGPGIGNSSPHRQVLIIAENDVDADGDGAVDVPDDAAAGGILVVHWITSDIFFQSATVIDIDANESAFLRIVPNTGNPVDLPLASLGNNSVQTVSANIGPARQIELHLSGSGALAELRVCSD